MDLYEASLVYLVRHCKKRKKEKVKARDGPDLLQVTPMSLAGRRCMGMSPSLSLVSICALEEFVIVLSWAECPQQETEGAWCVCAVMTGFVGLSHMPADVPD